MGERGNDYASLSLPELKTADYLGDGELQDRARMPKRRRRFDPP